MRQVETPTVLIAVKAEDSVRFIRKHEVITKSTHYTKYLFLTTKFIDRRFSSLLQATPELLVPRPAVTIKTTKDFIT